MLAAIRTLLLKQGHSDSGQATYDHSLTVQCLACYCYLSGTQAGPSSNPRHISSGTGREGRSNCRQASSPSTLAKQVRVTNEASADQKYPSPSTSSVRRTCSMPLTCQAWGSAWLLHCGIVLQGSHSGTSGTAQTEWCCTVLHAHSPTPACSCVSKDVSQVGCALTASLLG